ncbi:transglycosylase SLT domain-containing protein [Dyella nitratireducens]|uniref:transglycosylase SLT domain-containing protein n=1 Tax=Dyella nitratireducens TaxID=1849580 RepID=UPI00166E3558|nr:transglycosylase SLT domain-containing protein [Dyella nitratireducens]
MTQRVYLCAPAAFRARRLGGSGHKIVIAAPCGWARQRRIAHRHQRVAEGLSGLGTLTVLPSWQAKLSFDTSHWLPAIKLQAQTYRVPIIGGLGLMAGTAAVAIGVHAWHAHANTSLAMKPVNIAKPLVAAAPARPSVLFAGVTGNAVSAPVRRIAPTKPKPSPATTLGLADDGTIVVVAEPHAVRAGGFNLDITSPGSLWAKAGARYRIDPVLIYAVALVETRGTQPDGSVAPCPWVVRINGHLHSGSRAETEHAIELAHLLAAPVQDVGIMQVYYPVHRDLEPDPIALLNPVRNIEIGTRLLRKAMNESGDPVLRIGYYHSHDATLARGYGQLVLSVYKELKLAMGRSPTQAVVLASAKADAGHVAM